jgi:hypothetical protein
MAKSVYKSLFFKLYDQLVYDERLTPTDAVVFSVLDFYCSMEFGYCFLTTEQILQQRRIGVNEKTFQRSLNRLEEFGFIYKEVSASVKGGKCRKIYNTYNPVNDTVFNPVIGVIDQVPVQRIEDNGLDLEAIKENLGIIYLEAKRLEDLAAKENGSTNQPTDKKEPAKTKGVTVKKVTVKSGSQLSGVTVKNTSSLLLDNDTILNNESTRVTSFSENEFSEDTESEKKSVNDLLTSVPGLHFAGGPTAAPDPAPPTEKKTKPNTGYNYFWKKSWPEGMDEALFEKTFNTLWDWYGHKADKHAAQKAWEKLIVDLGKRIKEKENAEKTGWLNVLRSIITAAKKSYAHAEAKSLRDGHAINDYRRLLSTWLNGKNWDDILEDVVPKPAETPKEKPNIITVDDIKNLR